MSENYQYIKLQGMLEALKECIKTNQVLFSYGNELLITAILSAAIGDTELWLIIPEAITTINLGDNLSIVRPFQTQDEKRVEVTWDLEDLEKFAQNGATVLSSLKK